MADSIANLLLRISGEKDDAERTLGDLTSDLSNFDKKSATAEAAVEADSSDLDKLASKLQEYEREYKAKVKVDTTLAQASLKDLKRAFAEVSGEDVQINTGAAAVRISQLRAQLKAIPDEEVNIKLDQTKSAFQGLTRLGNALIGLKGQAVVSLAALGGSATSAGIAVGGIGAAALGVIAPFGVLGAAVKLGLGKGTKAGKEFKAEMKELSKEFQKALGPAVKEIIPELIAGIGKVKDILPELSGPFQVLGKEAGTALRGIIDMLTSPEWVAFFKTLIGGASQAVKPLTGILKGLLNIFKNLATAGLPILIEMLKRASNSLKAIGDKTSDIEKLRSKMQEGVVVLEKLWEIGKNVALIIADIFRGSEAAGSGLLQAIQDVTRDIHTFLSSAEGQDSLKKLFAAIIPFIKEIGATLPVLIPIFANIIDIANTLLIAILKVVRILNKIPVVGPGIASVLTLFLLMKGPLKILEGSLGIIANGLGNVAKGLIEVAKKRIKQKLIASGATAGAGVAGDVAGGAAGGAAAKKAGAAAGGGFLAGLITKLKGIGPAIVSAFTKGGPAVKVAVGFLVAPIIAGLTALAAFIGIPVGAVVAIILGIVAVAVLVYKNWKVVKEFLIWSFGQILAGAKLYFSAFTTVVLTPVRITIAVIKALFGALKATLGAIWNAIKTVAKIYWNAIKFAVLTPVRIAVAAVKAIFSGAKTALSAIWGAIKSAASRVWGAIKTVVTAPVRIAITIIKALWGKAKTFLSIMWLGIKATARRVFNGIKDVILGPIRSAVQKILDLGTAAFKAGKAFIMRIVDGIKSAAGAVKDAVGNVLKGARDKLPFSEPKDPSSPLRGLKQSGEAILTQLGIGIEAGAGGLARQMTDALQGATVGATATSALAPVAAAAGVPNTTTNATTQNFNIPASAPAQPQPDARVTAALLAREMRRRGA